MKIQNYALVGMCVALLSACGTFSRARQANLNRVRPGQTCAEVEQVLGAPKKKLKKNGNEIWLYELYSDNNAQVYPYSAKFQSGVLKSFDFETSRTTEDAKLREQRLRSNQTLPSFHFGPDVQGSNGSPPLTGTGVRD